MLSLMQVATLPPQPTQSLMDLLRTLTPVALFVLAWMQTVSIRDRNEMRAELLRLTEVGAKQATQLATLNAHVGVDGNGIMARLDGMVVTLDEIKNELAENRGQQRHIRPGS